MNSIEITREILRLRQDAMAARMDLRKGGSQLLRCERKHKHLAEYYLGQEVALARLLQAIEEGERNGSE